MQITDFVRNILQSLPLLEKATISPQKKKVQHHIYILHANLSFLPNLDIQNHTSVVSELSVLHQSTSLTLTLKGSYDVPSPLPAQPIIATMADYYIMATLKRKIKSKGILSGQWPLYLILGGCLLAVSTIAVVIGFLCCRKRNQNTTPDRSKKGYQKGNQNIKPPDLWIHHDQMELKSMEKGHSNNDGASSSGAMTLPRSVGGNDYDNHENVHSNSLDKRSYVPSYGDDKNKRSLKSKPISLPVDSKPPREPIATPINTASSDSTPSSKTSYPRTQYSMPRTHTAALEASSTPHSHTSDNLYSQHQQNNPSYDSNAPPTIGFLSQPPPPVAHIPPGSTYAPGMSVLSDAQAGKRVPGQGHPLKSFTVPAPPPISAPGTPQPKHIVTVRPSSSPFKKAPTSSSSTLTSTPPSRISASNPPPHTADELQRLHPSHSTEELNQEMANLEGLMLTLNEITANEFEC